MMRSSANLSTENENGRGRAPFRAIGEVDTMKDRGSLSISSLKKLLIEKDEVAMYYCAD